MEMKNLHKVKELLTKEVDKIADKGEMNMQTLDNLLMNKHITLKQYLERLPSGYITKKQELLDELAAQSMLPPPGTDGTGMSVATTSENLPVNPGSGNGALQRALNREGT